MLHLEMADYSKLTVVKLKEELKQRGLPQTGLKAALIARLTEADASSQPAPAPIEDEVLQMTEKPVDNGDNILITTESIGSDTQYLGPAPDTRNAENHVSSQPELVPDKPLSQHESIVDVEATIHPIQGAQAGATDERPVVDAIPTDPATEPSLVTTPDIVENQVSPQISTSAPLSTPPTHHSESISPFQNSTQTSLNREEILEDSRKRKRRSQSPPPSAHDSALKKVKALDGSPRVKLPEDAISDIGQGSPDQTTTQAGALQVEILSGEHTKDVVMDNAKVGDSLSTGNEAAKELPSVSNENKGLEVTDVQRRVSLGQTDTIRSPVKASPSDTRFKTLFSAPTKPAEISPSHDPYPGMEDRDISPALHPATTALYIRNFMRPLQPSSLKEHLGALAKPANNSPSGDIITEFFLDSIRTHCFVQFASVAAASRVRTALHDRVWPDQKTRKPLWIDFIPEEKFKKWVDVEEQSGSGSGRNQSSKRWEVVYEHADAGIAAYLQEADGAGPPNTSVLNASGHQGAPARPRATEAALSNVPSSRGDIGKGFKALDDLFRSTVAKPKLYYLPVAEPIANRRLDKLAAGRGGGRSDEMRRFTFEEETIVDKGPEYGSGWRGGFRGRGAYTGGYSARGGGGGYRGGGGDNWRGGR